ncbi:MAG: ATP-binding protein [Nitrospira sp.]|nr:ATP-binding protein [Nitrospira sp.]MCP9462351.1 ATP-binding protein [Nitrospira sp.]MCP9474357.1 ATP-binding protein [Nitrospira sp.]
MYLFDKPLDSITEDDIRLLIDNSVREGRGLEYKQALPNSSDDDRREFLADVSSFANASGGDLVYGIQEKRDSAGKPTGEPERIVPLNANPDAETLRLHELAQTGIEPRIPGLRIKAVSLEAGGFVLIVRVPKSWAGLHMVTFKNLSRFYSRNSSGKYQLDVQEIRAGFVAAETGRQKLASFRIERVTKIVANEGPVSLAEGPKAILHLIPLSALDPTMTWDPVHMSKEPSFGPLATNIKSCRYNFDGALSEATNSYLQFFRNGMIELCTGTLFSPREKQIASYSFEQHIILSSGTYRHCLQNIGVSPPLIFFLSLTGVAGYTMGLSAEYGHLEQTPIRDPVLLFPEIVMDSFDQPIDHLLRPVFDRLWNAVGFERSPNYNDEGKWSAKFDPYQQP